VYLRVLKVLKVLGVLRVLQVFGVAIRVLAVCERQRIANTR
jgi:hypothetical protein